jgi:hypothetical protein
MSDDFYANTQLPYFCRLQSLSVEDQSLENETIAITTGSTPNILAVLAVMIAILPNHLQTDLYLSLYLTRT